MTNNKKIKWIIISIVTIIITIFFISNKTEMSDYDKAKKEILKFLTKNITELEKICKESLIKKDTEIHEFKGKVYYNSFRNGKECVVICINVQGMLGGQYWDLVFCEDDILYNKSIDINGNYIDDTTGNNIFIMEKLKDNWYLSYEDWDGKTDTSKIIK